MVEAISYETKCYAVYSNLQGAKNGKCSFYHSIDGDSHRHRGNIIQMDCNVKIYVFTPVFDNDNKPSTKHMAILCFGEHTHPPPPPRKIKPSVKAELIKVIKTFGAAEATARRLVASPILSIMLNGATSLSQEHIALTNQDAVNHIIRKERLKEYPWGTDFQGAQFLMQQQGLSDPYIRETVQYSDSTFVILCQFKAQSQLLFESHEIQADKTFSRTRCREFEINAFNHSTKRTTTIARVFINSETEEGYYHAFNLVFKTAEADMGKRIPWGHLVTKTSSEVRIKAVLVDMHGAQVKGLGKYFAKEYNDHNAAWHVVRIVKTCRVHYERSVRRLETKGVTSG